jgi:hypothetical protein
MNAEYLFTKRNKGANLAGGMRVFSEINPLLEHIFDSSYKIYSKPSTVVDFLLAISRSVSIYRIGVDGNCVKIGKGWLKQHSSVIEERYDLLAEYLLRS